jgi:hypothetical protein
MSEAVEEREKLVGGPVSGGWLLGAVEASQRGFFGREVGFEVLVGGRWIGVPEPQRDRRGIDWLWCAEQSHRGCVALTWNST